MHKLTILVIINLQIKLTQFGVDDFGDNNALGQVDDFGEYSSPADVNQFGVDDFGDRRGSTI